MNDTFATRVYVVGEVLISLTVICGAGALLLFSQSGNVQLVAASAVGAVTTFWFARRQGEQGINAMREIANGKLATIIESQAELSRTLAANSNLQTQLVGRVTQASESTASAATELAASAAIRKEPPP